MISFQQSSECSAAAVASVLYSGSQFPPVSLKRAGTHRKHVGETSNCGLQTCWLTTNMPGRPQTRRTRLRAPVTETPEVCMRPSAKRTQLPQHTYITMLGFADGTRQKSKYFLAISHSYGKCSISRGFMMMHLSRIVIFHSYVSHNRIPKKNPHVVTLPQGIPSYVRRNPIQSHYSTMFLSVNQLQDGALQF